MAGIKELSRPLCQLKSEDVATTKNEMVTPEASGEYFSEGTCRCCLAQGNFKSMQCRNPKGGFMESYTDMLRAMFNITLTLVRLNGDLLICSSCETQLQNAFAFRTQVLESEKKFLEKTQVKLFEVEISVKEHVYDVKNQFVSIKIENVDYEDEQYGETPSIDNDAEDVKSYAIEIPKARSSRTIKKENIKLNHELKRERSTNKETSYFKCIFCSEGFRMKKLLSMHYKSVHMPVKCPLCEKTFDDKISDYTTHVRAKHGSNVAKRKRFKCDVCNKSFPNCYATEKHVKKNHHQCRKCFLMFRNVFERDEHKQIHPAHCKVCKTEFTTEFLLNDHMVEVHNTLKFHRCGICRHIFESMQGMLKHKVDVHGAAVFPCGACDEFYYRECLLIKHQRQAHMLERNYSCPSCDYKAFDASKLKRHMIRHSNVKPYECEYCKKRFARATTLRYHERIHTGDKRQVCRLCDAAFVQRASLKYHLEKYHAGQF